MIDTREYILKTSLLLFLQKSYKDVTMKEILDKTKLSKGAFYHHFDSKEALFKEIVMLFFATGQQDYSTYNAANLRDFYRQYVENIGDSIAELNQMVSNSNFGSGTINFFFIMFEAVNRFPEFLSLELQQHKNDLDEWKKVIARARAKKEIVSSSSDEEIANLFLFCSDGVFIRFINNDQQLTFKTYLLNAFDTIYANLVV